MSETGGHARSVDLESRLRDHMRRMAAHQSARVAHVLEQVLVRSPFGADVTRQTVVGAATQRVLVDGMTVWEGEWRQATPTSFTWWEHWYAPEYALHAERGS